MPRPAPQFSVLDLAPICEGGDAAQTFRNSLELARHVEQLGYARSLQCASTLAVMRKETGSARAPVYAFLSMTTLAYVVAVITFHAARALGAA